MRSPRPAARIIAFIGSFPSQYSRSWRPRFRRSRLLAGIFELHLRHVRLDQADQSCRFVVSGVVRTNGKPVGTNEVHFDALTARVHARQIVHGLRVAVFGCPLVPSARLAEVLPNACTCSVHDAEARHAVAAAVLRCLSEMLHGPLRINRSVFAPSVHETDAPEREAVPLARGFFVPL